MTTVTVRSGTSAAPAAPEAPTALGALGPDSFRDSRGRVITLRSLSILEQMRLLRSLGGENGPFYSFCLRLARVASIDGDPVGIPQKELQWEALAQRLGDAGIMALTAFMMGPDEDADGGEDADPDAAAQAVQAQDNAERATVKN